MQDDRIDLAAQFGLYIMPINIGVEVSGLFAEEGTLDFTTPLPSFVLRMDLALTPKSLSRTKKLRDWPNAVYPFLFCVRICAS